MPKVVLSNITSRYASVAALNSNFTALATAIENTLSRDGTSPNSWLADQDANGQRLLNLPPPTLNTEPVRLVDLSGLLAGTPTAATVSVEDAGGLFTGVDVESVLAEIGGEVDTNTTGLANHLADTVDAHDASAISVVAGSGIVATTVQAALVELQGEITTNAGNIATNTSNIGTNATSISNHISDATAAHAASAISVTPSGNLTSTDVQAALVELQGDVDTLAGAARTWSGNLYGTDRLSGTPYTNTAGREIEVMVAFQSLVAGQVTLNITLDGVVHPQVQFSPPGSLAAGGYATFSVPDGDIYTVTVGGNVASLWRELS